MKCNLKNLLPDDTRIVELTTAISMGLTSMLVLFTDNVHHLVKGFETWFSTLFVLSMLQFISLVFIEKLEVIRVYSSLLIGGLLVYLGITHIGDASTFNYTTQIILGIANLYAFLVNNQRLVWR